jgi:hypothetical protein
MEGGRRVGSAGGRGSRKERTGDDALGDTSAAVGEPEGTVELSREEVENRDMRRVRLAEVEEEIEQRRR